METRADFRSRALEQGFVGLTEDISGYYGSPEANFYDTVYSITLLSLYYKAQFDESQPTVDQSNKPTILPTKTKLETREHWTRWITVLRNYAKGQDTWDAVNPVKPELTTD